LKKSIYIFLFALIFINCDDKKEYKGFQKVEFNLLSSKNEFFAGNSIELAFNFTVIDKTVLIVENSYGTVTLNPEIKNETAHFHFPEFIARKSGVTKWTLVREGNIEQEGNINILPNTIKETEIETYLGPRSITAGNSDFAMHVIAPTDYTDNPLLDGTIINSIYQFENNITKKEIELKNLLGWLNIYSPKKSGRMLVTASCNKINAKELTTIVYPALATNFQISYDRNHDYADGNQVIVFSTDIIKDSFGNTVSDGTLVSFVATNSKNVQLHATGTTLAGIAQARMLHPFQKDNWLVKAYVTGAAESKTIQIAFKSAIKDFQLLLSNNNREIAIRDIKSFMQQIVPDGIPIALKVYDENDILLNTLNTTSRLGTAVFQLEKDFYTSGKYTIEINTAGIIKKKSINLK